MSNRQTDRDLDAVKAYFKALIILIVFTIKD